MGELFAGRSFVAARMRAGWRLLLVTAVGVVMASGLLAAAPIYAEAMANLGLQFRLGRALIDTGSRLNWVGADGLLPDRADLERRRAIDETFEARLGWLGERLQIEERSPRFTLGRLPADADSPADLTSVAASWATFVYALSDLERLTTTVEGRLPAADTESPEVVLVDGFQRHVALGQRLAVQVGGFTDCQNRPASEVEEEARDERRCVPTTRVAQAATATVVGFVRPRDPEDPRWQIFSGSLVVPETPRFVSLQDLSQADIARAQRGEGSMPLLTTPEQLRGALGRAMPLVGFSHRVGVVVDVAAVRTDDIERAITSAAELETDLESRLGLSPRIALPAARELQGFRNSLTFNQVPLLLILLQVAGIVIYYVVIVSSMLVERQAEEIGVFRSRGASTAQLVGLYLMEALVLAVPAALLSPWLAGRAVALLGLTATFRGMTDGSALPVEIGALAYVLGAAGALLALIAMLLPAFFAARRGIIDVQAEQARPPGRSALQRYYIDVAAVALAGLLLWQLGRRGTIFDPQSVGGWSSDPLLLLSPLVFTLAVAALLLRLYPPLLRWTVSALLAARTTSVALGLRRAARSPATYARLMLLLVMAVSVGTFAASYGPTVDASQADRIRYDAGAEFRGNIAGTSGTSEREGIEAVRALEGVRSAALASRGSAQTLDGAPFSLLGLDPERASNLLWFRDDFAAEPLDVMLRRLQSNVPPGGGLELPADTEAVSVGVFGESGRARSMLWARYRDTEGNYYLTQLGAPDFEGWRTLVATLPEEASRPLYFSGLLLSDDRSAGVRRDGGLYFDDVQAVRAGGATELLDDFEGRFGWTLFGLVRADETFELSTKQPLSGRSSMYWAWRVGVTEGRRMFAVNPGNVPLAAIVSPNVAALLGARAGDVAQVQLDGHVIPIAVRAVAELFPTLSPQAGFVVVNREDLEALAELLEVPTGRHAGELWVDIEAAPERRVELVSLLGGESSPLRLSGRPIDSEALIADARADPTLRASGSGILGAAFGAVLALSALGFIVTLGLGAWNRTIEFAVLRAVGSSRLQILRALALEWGVVLALGLAIGVLLGRRIASVMLSFLDVTEQGGRVLPPFALETDWVALAAGALLLVSVVAAGLGVAWAAAIRRADAAQLRITR